MKPTLSAFDSNILQCNGKYIALNANVIGSIAVIPVNETGKAPEHVPMFTGHAGGNVLDTSFDPFDEQRFVSAGEDGKVMIWEIPKDYTYYNNDPEKIEDVKPIGQLSGHRRKVGHVKFSPVTKDIVASSSFDYSVKIWDLATKKCISTLQHKDLVTSFCFNYNGTKIATACRDKHLRVWDVRSGKLLTEGMGHPSAKSTRIIWLGPTERLLTTGFDRFSERQIALWDAEDLSKGTLDNGKFIAIDSSSGVLIPFYDASTHLVFIGGKGDGNIRYYEFADDQLYDISEFQSTDAQRGLAVAPKRYVNIQENEILRVYKLLNDNSIEPVSFIVPRRTVMFQDDIYPDAPADKYAQTSEEFLAGKTVDGPVMISMEDLYEGKENPTVKTAKEEEKTAKKEEPVKKEEPKKVETTEKKVEKHAEVKQEEIKPVFTKSQEQGVDSMLKGKSVNSMLDKVEHMSDDDTQDVDAGSEREWEPVEVPKLESETSKKSIKESTLPKVSKLEKAEPKIERATEAENKAAKIEKPAKAESQHKAEKPKAVSVETSKTKVSGKAIGLKATVARLQDLVDKLENSVEKLTQTNLDKDERLKAIEAKLDKLLEN